VSQRPVALITGANGEIGHGLIERLAAEGRYDIVALDLSPLSPELGRRCAATRLGSITDRDFLAPLARELDIEIVFHLAALLSTRSERHPHEAHEVNVGGTLNLLDLAVEAAKRRGSAVKFFFPSSIAVYGMPDLETKRGARPVREDQFTSPATMYGCNKLYCEHLGRYYMRHYKRLDAGAGVRYVDFRGLRFPGLISAHTVPTGGTSDYGPEMIHAAAQGKEYQCFVRPDAKISFMAMPDAIDATLRLMDAPAAKLTLPVYNVTAFAPTAAEFASAVKGAFPDARIGFTPDEKRLGIIDSWPEDTDDAAARKDWGFAPSFDWQRCFAEYLLPNVRRRYAPAH
jgi:threonine 3-dehydrogenase